MLAAVLCAATIACAEADAPGTRWRVTQVVDGVKGSLTRASAQPWGAAEGTVSAPVETILQHLVDFDQMPGRIPWLAETRVLEQNAGEALVYFRYDLPWPFADRDYTARYRWTALPTGEGQVEVVDANASGPPPGGAVRVSEVHACFTLDPVARDLTRVTYRVHMALGGLLPRQVQEDAVAKLALRSLLGLRRYFPPPLAGPGR